MANNKKWSGLGLREFLILPLDAQRKNIFSANFEKPPLFGFSRNLRLISLRAHGPIGSSAYRPISCHKMDCGID